MRGTLRYLIHQHTTPFKLFEVRMYISLNAARGILKNSESAGLTQPVALFYNRYIALYFTS